MRELIYKLELELLKPSVRQSTEQLNRLISDDFIEFGSSGKVYNKQDVLESLSGEAPRKFTVEDFKISELSKDVILATYKSIEDSNVSLRSSIWKQFNRDWKMVFHQGTKCGI